MNKLYDYQGLSTFCAESKGMLLFIKPTYTELVVDDALPAIPRTAG